MTLWFVTGGARSGKSAFAERLAAGTQRPVVYIATLEPLDEEMRDRVGRHREARPAQWETVEAPLALAAALEAVDGDACALVDCLSLWVSNRLLAAAEDEPSLDTVAAIEAELVTEVERLIELAAGREGETVVVTNEVGSGVVPPAPLGRAYRDLLGRVNQRVSLAAERAWLLASGRAIELPPIDLPPAESPPL